MVQILLTHTPEMRANYYGERALAGLRALGSLKLHEQEEVLSGAALIEAAKGCQIVIADRQTAIPADFFAGATDVMSVSRVAVDIRNIDVSAASSKGILVTQATPGFIASVSEMAVGYMVNLGRYIPEMAAEYHAGRVPVARMGKQLKGSTLGILGFGAIGQYLAKLGVALGMTVLVYDPYKTIAEPGVAQVSFEDALAKSDFVVCLVVANEATEKLMNAAAFARMRKDAYFLNLSRGNLVDDAALADALDKGIIAGAALDVGRAPDQMPMPDLAKRPNVIATPHCAGLTPPAIEHQALDTVKQAGEIVAGRMPPGAVNAEQATRVKEFWKGRG